MLDAHGFHNTNPWEVTNVAGIKGTCQDKYIAREHARYALHTVVMIKDKDVHSTK